MPLPLNLGYLQESPFFSGSLNSPVNLFSQEPIYSIIMSMTNLDEIHDPVLETFLMRHRKGVDLEVREVGRN